MYSVSIRLFVSFKKADFSLCLCCACAVLCRVHYTLFPNILAVERYTFFFKAAPADVKKARCHGLNMLEQGRMFLLEGGAQLMLVMLLHLARPSTACVPLPKQIVFSCL